MLINGLFFLFVFIHILFYLRSTFYFALQSSNYGYVEEPVLREG